MQLNLATIIAIASSPLSLLADSISYQVIAPGAPTGNPNSQTVGSISVSSSYNAVIFTDSTKSSVAVNLDPGVSVGSVANCTNGNQQGGAYLSRAGNGSLISYAAIWSGTAASFTSLHPASATYSTVNAIDSTSQGGYATISGRDHASIWYGTTNSFVDLHPTGYWRSYVNGISGAQQVGYAGTGIGNYACMWNGSSQSYTIMHPSWAYANSNTFSRMYLTTGQIQVGSVGDDLGYWTGTADSFTVISTALPSNYTGSYSASAIWTDANTTYILGSAYNVATSANDTILWSVVAIPEPTAALPIALILPVIAYRARRRRAA